jgi:hypothetical protein
MAPLFYFSFIFAVVNVAALVWLMSARAIHETSDVLARRVFAVLE